MRSISLDLLGRDRLVVGEVEAQAVRRDERAGLLDVVAEHLAQRVVQQVGARCGCGGSRRGGRRRWPPSPAGPATTVALDEAADVAAQVGQGERRVEDLDGAGLGADRAAVADLATALGVERRAVEEDLDAGRSSPSLDRRGTHGQDARPRRCRRRSRRTRSCRTARRPRGRRRGWRRRRPSGGPPWPAGAARAISVSKPGDVDGDAALAGDLLGELEREAVRVVEHERRRARQLRRAARRARPRGSTGRCAASGGSAPPPCRARRR